MCPLKDIGTRNIHSLRGSSVRPQLVKRSKISGTLDCVTYLVLHYLILHPSFQKCFQINVEKLNYD